MLFLLLLSTESCKDASAGGDEPGWHMVRLRSSEVIGDYQVDLVCPRSRLMVPRVKILGWSMWRRQGGEKAPISVELRYRVQ